MLHMVSASGGHLWTGFQELKTQSEQEITYVVQAWGLFVTTA